MLEKSLKRRVGIIAGLDAVGAADDLFKRLEGPLKNRGENEEAKVTVLLERSPFLVRENLNVADVSQSERKIHVFNAILALAQRQVDLVLLPCFLSHTFLDEIEAEAPLRIVNMMEALRDHLVSQSPRIRKLGILTSDHVRNQCLFERYFPKENWNVLYPSEALQRDGVMPVLGNPEGIRAKCDDVIGTLVEVCHDLMKQGVEVIIPGAVEILILADAMRERGIPLIDVNEIYAEYALSRPIGKKTKPFKIGVVGGVGPAATVDFIDKIVRNTPASRDQEHVKLVVEQNPQIPDRTANLLSGGVDPTIALYATCKKLEADDASIIAIPCNTAHAFVERIQPYLSIPIVNMLRETVEHIKRTCAGRKVIGLLATDGTIGSRVYHDVILPAGFELRVPDAENQRRVMNAIYGPKGVKAGYTEGECTKELLRALTSLVDGGAEIIVLGCTELPLLVQENEAFAVAGKTVMVLDPTAILARKCVGLRASVSQGS